MKTNYKREFPPKRGRPETANLSQKYGVSKGMTFGDSNQTAYNSFYNVEYNKDRGYSKPITKADRMKLAERIKKSNIILGEDRNYYTSEHDHQYSKKSGGKLNPILSTKELRESHIRIGINPNCFETTTKVEYGEKEKLKNN